MRTMTASWVRHLFTGLLFAVSVGLLVTDTQDLRALVVFAALLLAWAAVQWAYQTELDAAADRAQVARIIGRATIANGAEQ